MPKFTLDPLPFAYDVFAPAISERTLRLHHDKHQRGYVDRLNELVAQTEFVDSTLDDIVMKADGSLLEQAEQHWNHDFAWKSMTPRASQGPQPGTLFYNELMGSFGRIDLLREEFEKKGAAHFGSGWLWLIADTRGKLSLLATPNAVNPMRGGLTPLLVCDLWEHSYYMDYQNLRGSYLKASYGLLNWEFAESRYHAVCKKMKIHVEEIKPGMPVVGSPDGQLGVVEHVIGRGNIRLQPDQKGQPHFIPLSWVNDVDDKVHLDRSGDQAKKQWSTKNPALL
jgi:superoxide dismutase, Fe-Mn family